MSSLKERAYAASVASGRAFKMDGVQVGEEDPGHFAMLMAQLCSELNIDHRDGTCPVTYVANAQRVLALTL